MFRVPRMQVDNQTDRETDSLILNLSLLKYAEEWKIAMAQYMKMFVLIRSAAEDVSMWGTICGATPALQTPSTALRHPFCAGKRCWEREARTD